MFTSYCRIPKSFPPNSWAVPSPDLHHCSSPHRADLQWARNPNHPCPPHLRFGFILLLEHLCHLVLKGTQLRVNLVQEGFSLRLIQLAALEQYLAQGHTRQSPSSGFIVPAPTMVHGNTVQCSTVQARPWQRRGTAQASCPACGQLPVCSDVLWQLQCTPQQMLTSVSGKSPFQARNFYFCLLLR